MAATRQKLKTVDRASQLPGLVNPSGMQAKQWRTIGVVLDTETTGLASDDEVIELAIVQAHDGHVLFDQRFRPTKRIDPYAMAVHHIHDDELASCLPFSHFYDEISRLLSNRLVLAWGAANDARFLRQTYDRYGLIEPPCEWGCLMKLYRAFRDVAKVDCKLSAACDALRVQPGDHSAVNDSIATARVLYRMAEYKGEVEILGLPILGAQDNDDVEKVTVRTFLESHQWHEQRTAGTDSDGEMVAVIWWSDPLTGQRMKMREAVDRQRERLTAKFDLTAPVENPISTQITDGTAAWLADRQFDYFQKQKRQELTQ